MMKVVLKNPLRSLARSLALLLAGTALAAQALTLGDVQGDAWIGMPLDLRIAFQADQDEAISAGCVSADIHYAEALQKAPRVTVQAQTLRLQLSDVVTEPVVAIQIRSTCGASQTRRYVLLADLPPSISAPLVPLSTLPAAAARDAAPNAGASGAAASPQRAVAGSSAGKASASKPKAKAKSKSKAKSKKAAKPQKKNAPKAKTPRAAKKTIPQTAQSMLKLDPMEILSDRMDTLDSSMLFAPTEDALLQSRQIASLQADLKAMQELAAKNDRSLLELRSQLQQAKGQQLPMALVYGLIALVLLCLTGLAWLWQRQRKSTMAANSWWDHPTDDELAAALFQPGNAAPASGDGSTTAAPKRAKPAPSQSLDLDFTLPKDSP